MLDPPHPSPGDTLARAHALIAGGHHAAAVTALYAVPAARLLFEAATERAAAARFMAHARADMRVARRSAGATAAAWLGLAARHRRDAGWHLARARRLEAEARL